MSRLQELWEILSFPIVETDKKGVILYKNAAVCRHLRFLRRGASLCRHIYGGTLTPGSALFPAGGVYPRALVLPEEDGFLLLFFSRLQGEDGEEAAKALFDSCGGDARALFAAFYHIRALEASPEATLPLSRADADIIRLFGSDDLFAGVRSLDLYSLLTKLRTRLCGAFRGLGYRIQMDVDERLRGGLNVKAAPEDFFFFIGRMLYLSMKLSQNGIVQIEATRDETRTPVLRFAVRTSLSPQRVRAYTLSSLFAAFAPECAAELAVFAEQEALVRSTSLRVDRYGKLLLEHRMRIASPQVLIIGSLEPSSHEAYAALSKMFGSLRRLAASDSKKIGSRP